MITTGFALTAAQQRTAVLGPHLWDAPGYRLEIHDCFDRVQIAVACRNGRQMGQYLKRLRQLTNAARQRHQGITSV